MNCPTIAGIYLAAGESRRMGTDKRALPWGESTLGAAGLQAALRSRLTPIIVVVPPADPLVWLPTELRDHEKCRFVRCVDHRRGQAHSLACGLQKALASGADAAVVLLADQPFVTADVINALADLYRRHRPDYVAFACFGTPMPPVIFGKQMFPALLALRGDAGGRTLFHHPRWRGLLYEGDETIGIDIDTKDDYKHAVMDREEKEGRPRGRR
ncbi:xanthine dehydrogenase accessory protein PucB [Geobacillus proteiniphilus]|uniref:Molybdopterin-guanine dinucleotide biosynthesis protein MobA n=1 Tax=Geobacillus proteiniphilus TaxID=860353 RepID=A0A1Q5SW61_9BACL|nr:MULTISPECIES: xanthine dehydrogenase accessory protein PucB [Geobacillus]OKO92224.1 Molybdopterin-guanine dinucleotide biosynthesis protein MobA [Geobacillus proteiniphilus]OPX01148.1 xanthine dehydrogenase accessory protein PucB [Geobacillus sp. LEMMY01]WMJ15846.1 xanthine dehydrogenase accessory protein PucB [Geobacillus proteiniphilus]